VPVDLSGKVAIVTGGGSGIGRGIARALAKSRATVVVAGRTAATLDDAAREIDELGGRGLSVVTDIREPEQLANLVDCTVDAFGGIDVLVNNAQTGAHGLLLDQTDKQMETIWRAGPFAVFRLMNLVHPHMKARGGGVIVNFGSGAQLLGDLQRYGLYAAGKSAIETLTRYAAVEWAADGIRVLMVVPLAVSETVERMMEEQPERYAAMVARVPLGRFGDPELDIGGPVAWLVSDEARYITGTTVTLDGGQVFLR
jgi:NAD(P)-dependent dehydrogenase (short-subunit alcohol dehydrogenase family)